MSNYSDFLNNIIYNANQDAVDMFSAKSFVASGVDGVNIVQSAINNITLSGSASVTNPEDSNYNRVTQVSELMPSQSGIVNTTLDFDLIDESQFIQEDSVSGTDFINGVVQLHDTSVSLTNASIVGESNVVTTQYDGTEFLAHNASASPWYDAYIDLLASSGNRNNYVEFHAKEGTSNITAVGTYHNDNRPTGTNSRGVLYRSNGYIYDINGYHAFGPSWVAGDYIGVGVEYSTKRIHFWKNGVYIGYGVYGLNGESYDATKNVFGSIFGYYASVYAYVRIYSKDMAYQVPTNYHALGSTMLYTTTPYYVTTSNQNQISLSGIPQINSLSVTNIKPASTEIKPLVSFDGRNQWKGVVNDSLSDVTGLGFDELTTSIAVFSQISVGNYNMVTIKSDGTLWTWGDNTYGQLGNGSVVDEHSPIQMGSDYDWVFSNTGTTTTHAIKADGTLWGCGLNSFGQLGDGTTIDKSTLVQIGTDADWVKVSTGTNSTVALKADGTIWAWGNNDYGQLGNGTLVGELSPIQIGTESNWSSITEGNYSTVALKADGTIWACGWNNNGQLGDGTLIDKSTLIQIGIGTNWIFITEGNASTMTIKADGTLWACGWNNNGQLGDGTLIDKSTLIQIGIGTNWDTVNTMSASSLGVKTDGTLWAWGDNYYGQLGDGTTVDKHSPIQIGTGADFTSISIRGASTAIIKLDGTLWTCGLNNHGQLGDSTIINKSTLAQIISGSEEAFLVLLQNALANYVISSEQSIDFAFQLATTDYYVTPSIDQVTLNYDESGYYQVNEIDYQIDYTDPVTTTVTKLSSGSKNIKLAIAL